MFYGTKLIAGLQNEEIVVGGHRGLSNIANHCERWCRGLPLPQRTGNHARWLSVASHWKTYHKDAGVPAVTRTR